MVPFRDGSAPTRGDNHRGQFGRTVVGGGDWLNHDEWVKLPLTGVDTALASQHTTLLRPQDGRGFVLGALNRGFVPPPHGNSSGWSKHTPAPLGALPACTVKLGLAGETI